MSAAPAPRRPQPFGILRTIDGYDVIDNQTGRALAHRPTAASANGVAYVMNQAAKAGRRGLETTLGAGVMMRRN